MENNLCLWCLHNLVCTVPNTIKKSGLNIDYKISSCSSYLSNSGLKVQNHGTPPMPSIGMDPKEVNDRSARIKNQDKPKDITDLNIMKEMNFSIE